MVTDPQDPCCQLPQCSVLATPSPSPVVPPTPFPNGSYPNPDLLPSKRPGIVPDLVPSPVPTGIPGILTGTLPTSTGRSHRQATGTHVPVSYTHLTLPTKIGV